MNWLKFNPSGTFSFCADALLGIKPIKQTRKADSRLQRRFQQIEKLPAKDKRQLVQVIDTYLKAAQVN